MSSVDRIFETLDRTIELGWQAVEMAKEYHEVFKAINEMGVPELLQKIWNGELIVLKKHEAKCPVCGYKFESPLSEEKP